MFALIEAQGKQYKVSEGDVFKVDKIEGEPETTVTIDKVLMTVDGENINVGQPYLDNVSVSATKLKDDKNKKLVVYKYKRRKDFDKKKGHRQTMTVLRVDKINL